MPSDQPPVQLRLAETIAPRAGRNEYRLVLDRLDQLGIDEVVATAPVDLEQEGGRFGRPKAYLCSDKQIYWVKTRSQTGLCAELIANRLAHQLGIGPGTKVVRLDPFLLGRRESVFAVGTTNLTDVISSKQMTARTECPPRIDTASWAQVAVFQSWIDLMDEQVLIGTKTGLIYSFDHGEAFRIVAPGPPRLVFAAIPGAQFDWRSGAYAGMSMMDAIDALTPIEIMEAVAGIPDHPGWQGSSDRRLSIGRWLVKRRPLLRKEVMTWLRTVD